METKTILDLRIVVATRLGQANVGQTRRLDQVGRTLTNLPIKGSDIILGQAAVITRVNDTSTLRLVRRILLLGRRGPQEVHRGTREEGKMLPQVGLSSVRNDATPAHRVVVASSPVLLIYQVTRSHNGAVTRTPMKSHLVPPVVQALPCMTCGENDPI